MLTLPKLAAETESKWIALDLKYSPGKWLSGLGILTIS